MAVFHYGFSLQGRSHITSNTPCQDAHVLKALPGGLVLAAIADGVGSAGSAQDGSLIAVSSLAQLISTALSEGTEPPEPITLLKKGFAFALAAIKKAALESGKSLSDFDTTLTAAIYDGRKVCIAHCGDGGVIGMDEEGRYHLLTQVQKGDAWNMVVPLRTGEEAWRFFWAEGEYKGLLLLTDGVFDVAAPPLLSSDEQPLYCAFLYRFLNGALAQKSREDVTSDLIDYLRSDACAAITDDMTAAAVIDMDSPAKHPGQEYIKEPDWQALRLERYYRLYPHLKPQPEEGIEHATGHRTGEEAI